ncbi:MAG: hypothetical protein V1846_04145 [Candidatus Komeilibacteria bacterium]
MLNQKGNIMAVAFIVAGVLMLAAGGLFAYSVVEQRKAEGLRVPVIKRPVAAHSDWKTYTNTQYGFSFKYPSEYSNLRTAKSESATAYTVQANGQLTSVGDKEALLTLTSSPTPAHSYPDLTVNVFSAEDFSFIDPIEGQVYVYHPETKNFWVAALNPKGSIHTSELKTVNGANTIGYLTGIGDMGALTQVLLFISSSKGQIIELSLYSGGALEGSTANDTKNVDIWKQIIKTFTLSDLTADWKTYTNAQYHYSFKYPVDWVIVDNKYDPRADNPFSSDTVQVHDPKDYSISFSVCPDDRGTDCIPFQDGSWSEKKQSIIVGGINAVETFYTIDSDQNCATCFKRSTITLKERPVDWKGGRDFLLLPGKNSSLIPAQILSTFKFDQ